MNLTLIKNLHREYFENKITSYIKGNHTLLSIPTGKRIFITNKYRETFNMGGGDIRTTPTFYSVFLVDVTFDGELTYIKENKSIEFPNLISCYDKNKINLTWRSYRNSLNIPGLKEYNKNIEPIISENSLIAYNKLCNIIDEEFNKQFIDRFLAKKFYK